MKLRLFVVVALALTTLAGHAQIGIYLNPIATHISNSTPDTGVFAFLGQDTTSRMFYGVDIGGYDDFFHGKSLTAGVDIRDSIVHGANAGLNSFLVGVRVSGKPFAMPLKPYVQGSVGIGSSHSAQNSLHVNREQFGLYVGADYALAKHVDFRVVEVGYGSVTTVSSQTASGTGSIPSANLISVSTGFVFRFR